MKIAVPEDRYLAYWSNHNHHAGEGFRVLNRSNDGMGSLKYVRAHEWISDFVRTQNSKKEHSSQTMVTNDRHEVVEQEASVRQTVRCGHSSRQDE